MLQTFSGHTGVTGLDKKVTLFAVVSAGRPEPKVLLTNDTDLITF